MLCLNFAGEIETLKQCIEYLSDKMDFSVTKDGIRVAVSKLDYGGVEITGGNSGYELRYGIIPDFCRGLCVLIDKIKKNEKDFIWKEDRKIEKCGLMADVSRNAVLKVEMVKDLISRIARMGMDTFMLYMEDTYKIENYEYFGYMRGAYTEAELKEIDDYAKAFGVEVVPCIQTLAHLATTLRWPYADGMKDTGDVLLVDEPKTYEFIESMIKTVSRGLSSERIHIGMDEAWGLGTGVYRQKHGEVNKLEMVTRHLNKVVEILDKYGKKPMMWGDMFFRLASKTGEYYDMNVEVPENIIKALPKDMVLAYWDYYSEDEETYRSMTKAFMQMQRRIAFFGGVWTWNGISVNYERTFRTMIPAFKACHEYGINEIYATLWGDNGGETSIYTSLLGLQFFAENVYSEDVSQERLYEMFRICTGYDAESFLALETDKIPEAMEYLKKEKPNVYVYAILTSKHILYQDVLQGLFDKQYESVDLKGHYKNCLDRIEKAETPADLKELFDYQRQLIKVLYLKCDIGKRLFINYQNRDIDALRKNREEVKVLADEFAVLHNNLATLWLKNNKPFGLDRLDLRFGGTLARIRRAEMRLNSYLSGEIEHIEELEEERLPLGEPQFIPLTSYNGYDSVSI